MILFPLGFQWANFAEDSCGQVCQEGAACISQCELGHQADAVVTHHHDWILKPRHACCLPGCAADSQKQGVLCVIEWWVRISLYFLSDFYTSICEIWDFWVITIPLCVLEVAIADWQNAADVCKDWRSKCRGPVAATETALGSSCWSPVPKQTGNT